MPTPSPKLTPEERRERLLEAGFPVDHVQDLPRLFDWANDRYFDGELQRPDRIFYNKAIKTYRGLFAQKLIHPTASHPAYQISHTSLSVAAAIRGDIVSLTDTLVHEMVHAWQAQMTVKENDITYLDRTRRALGQPRHYRKGHGRWFHHIADQINSAFPEVLITVSGKGKDLNKTMDTPDIKLYIVVVDVTAKGSARPQRSMYYCERPLTWRHAEEVKRRIELALPSFEVSEPRLFTTTDQNARKVRRLNNDGSMPAPNRRSRRVGTRVPVYSGVRIEKIISQGTPVARPGATGVRPTPAAKSAERPIAQPNARVPASPQPSSKQISAPQTSRLTGLGEQYGASSLAKTLALIAERHPEALPESTIRAPLSASRVPHLTDQALACVLEGWKAVDAPRTAKNLASVAKLTDGASRLASPSLGEKAYLTWIEAGPKRYSFGEWCGALAGLLEERRPEWFSSQSEADTHLQRSLDLAFDGAVPEATAALGTATTSAMDSLGLADDLFNPDARSNVARALLLGASGARSSDYRNKGPSASSARPGAFDSEVPGPMAMTP